LVAGGEACAAEKKETVFVETKIGDKVAQREIRVEVMRSAAERARGLMYRRNLGDNDGMLFLFGQEQELSMWMKNTYVGLDMVFIKADGRILRIEKDAEPLSERVIASEGPASAVLEITAGGADRLGLKPGDRIQHAELKGEAR
jgi:uncharacterized protein